MCTSIPCQARATTAATTSVTTVTIMTTAAAAGTSTNVTNRVLTVSEQQGNDVTKFGRDVRESYISKLCHTCLA